MIVKMFKIEKHLKISVSLTSNILFTTALTKSPPHSCYLSMVVKYFTLTKRPPSVCSDKCHVINVYKGENEKCPPKKTILNFSEKSGSDTFLNYWSPTFMPKIRKFVGVVMV